MCLLTSVNFIKSTVHDFIYLKICSGLFSTTWIEVIANVGKWYIYFHTVVSTLQNIFSNVYVHQFQHSPFQWRHLFFWLPKDSCVCYWMKYFVVQRVEMYAICMVHYFWAFSIIISSTFAIVTWRSILLQSVWSLMW
jgi:hypothetical protein